VTPVAVVPKMKSPLHSPSSSIPANGDLIYYYYFSLYDLSLHSSDHHTVFFKCKATKWVRRSQ